MERPRFDIVASGERMREIRRQRNISVKQVMEYMGFESTQAVYKWEAGKCYPQADNLVALAILYNVSPMELLVEEDRVLFKLFMGEFICGIADQQLLDEKILPVYYSKKRRLNLE